MVLGRSSKPIPTRESGPKLPDRDNSCYYRSKSRHLREERKHAVPDREEMKPDTKRHPSRAREDAVAEIGRFVRARRKANGLTQQELAELTGVGTRFVSELERGKPTVRVEAVNRVLAAFGMRLGVVDAVSGAAETHE